MSESLGLGKRITTKQHRDAVHIAVAPVEAGCKLKPGQHIGLIGTQAWSKLWAAGIELIGIVDPFLDVEMISPGEKFWMYLYPGSITSLRHEWTHPAFVQPQARDDQSYGYSNAEEIAEERLRQFHADNMPSWVSFDEFVRDTSNGDCISSGDQEWGPARVYPGFWDDLSLITGRNIARSNREENIYFSCAC